MCTEKVNKFQVLILTIFSCSAYKLIVPQICHELHQRIWATQSASLGVLSPILPIYPPQGNVAQHFQLLALGPNVSCA